jgi:hypothetical protein
MVIGYYNIKTSLRERQGFFMTRFGQADQFRQTVLPIFNTSFYIHLFRSASIIKQDATATPRLQVGTT